MNLSAITSHLLESDNKVLLVCAGWKGKVNLEDTLFAGAIVDRVKDQIEPDCDAPLAAQHLYSIAKNDMVSFLGNASHVKRLAKLNIHKDIEFCMTPDQYTIVPILREGVLTI